MKGSCIVCGQVCKDKVCISTKNGMQPYSAINIPNIGRLRNCGVHKFSRLNKTNGEEKLFFG